MHYSTVVPSLLIRFLISISILTGCSPDKSKDEAKPVEATSSDSKDSKSDGEPKELIGNLLDRVKVANLEEANQRYGKNKIENAIFICCLQAVKKLPNYESILV